MKNYMKNARLLRNVYGYSQEYIAYKMNISQSLYSKIENGNIIPTIDYIDKLATIFSISINDLLNLDELEIMKYMQKNSFSISDSDKQIY